VLPDLHGRDEQKTCEHREQGSVRHDSQEESAAERPDDRAHSHDPGEPQGAPEDGGAVVPAVVGKGNSDGNEESGKDSVESRGPHPGCPPTAEATWAAHRSRLRARGRCWGEWRGLGCLRRHTVGVAELAPVRVAVRPAVAMKAVHPEVANGSRSRRPPIHQSLDHRPESGALEVHLVTRR